MGLLDEAVPLQEAMCCRSRVDTDTMHSAEGSEAAAAHELCMWVPTPCEAGAWAAERVMDLGVDDEICVKRRDTGTFHSVCCDE